MDRGLPKRGGRSGGLTDEDKFLRKLVLILIPIVVIGSSVLVYLAWIQTPPKIGVINVNGTIEGFDYAGMAEKAMNDPSIESVVLRINSPGGGVAGTFQAETSITKLSYAKPVVASLQEYATSGAYVVASAADCIYSYEQTRTAGLGVIAIWVSKENYYEQKGIEYCIWKTGERKDMGAPWRGPTEEENAYMRGLVENFEEELFWTITTNRPESENYIDEIRDGRIILGLQALRYRMVDRMGSYEDAVQRAADMAGLDEGEYETVDLGEYY